MPRPLPLPLFLPLPLMTLRLITTFTRVAAAACMLSAAVPNNSAVMPTHCFAFGAILEDRRVRRKARAGKCG